MIASVPAWAWLGLAWFLATTVQALVDLRLTRMKLAFAMKVLQPSAGRDDPEAARKDLDATRKFMAPQPGRRVQRPRLPQPRSWRGTGARRASARSGLGDADERTTAA